MAVIDLTLSEFKAQLYDDTSAVLIYFWRPDCLLCQDMTPLVEEVTLDSAQHIRLAKVNVIAEPLVADLMCITETPTYVIMLNRDVADAFTGLVSAAALQDIISPLLGVDPHDNSAVESAVVPD
jgi:thioredoxin 1